MPNSETAAVRTLEDLAASGLHDKRVLVRVDFNVPLSEDDPPRVADDTRIGASLPTIRWLMGKGARVVLMTHLGRPKGWDPRLSAAPVAERLGELLNARVGFVDDIVGTQAQAAVAALPPGGVLMLQNVRFDPRETQNDPRFADQLAALGDFYVDDAFGTAHRAHASVSGVPDRLTGAAGFLLARELDALGDLIGNPRRPFWAIVGGAKVADKAVLLNRLVERADGLVIGGGMANCFLAAQGISMGASRVEPEQFPAIRETLARAEAHDVPVILPQDVVVTKSFAPDAKYRVCAVQSIEADEMALDLGPQSLAAIQSALSGARTIFWNGPMGVFEWDPFAKATLALAEFVSQLPAAVVIGGGDSAAAVQKAGVAHRIRHISTGGGAALEFLEGKRLPGVAAVER